jgi:hypothetical protein
MLHPILLMFDMNPIMLEICNESCVKHEIINAFPYIIIINIAYEAILTTLLNHLWFLADCNTRVARFS